MEHLSYIYYINIFRNHYIHIVKNLLKYQSSSRSAKPKCFNSETTEIQPPLNKELKILDHLIASNHDVMTISYFQAYLSIIFVSHTSSYSVSLATWLVYWRKVSHVHPQPMEFAQLSWNCRCSFLCTLKLWLLLYYVLKKKKVSKVYWYSTCHRKRKKEQSMTHHVTERKWTIGRNSVRKRSSQLILTSKLSGMVAKIQSTLL